VGSGVGTGVPSKQVPFPRHQRELGVGSGVRVPRGVGVSCGEGWFIGVKVSKGVGVGSVEELILFSGNGPNGALKTKVAKRQQPTTIPRRIKSSRSIPITSRKIESPRPEQLARVDD
jgi:hypothetical protein